MVLLAILAGSGSVMQAAPAPTPTAAEAAAAKTAIENATKTCAQAADLCTIVPPTTVKVALACRPAIKVNRMLYCAQHVLECTTENLARIENRLPSLPGSMGLADLSATTVAQILKRLRGMRAVCQVAVNTVMEATTTLATASAAATEVQAEARDETKADADAKAGVAKINAEAEEAQKVDESGVEGGVEADVDGGVEGGVEGGLIGGVLGGMLGGGDGGMLDQPLYAGIGGVTNPELITSSKKEPTYPESARKEKVSGQVILQVVVRKDGTVGDIQVLRSPGSKFGFDEAAIAAVKQWRYKPGLQNGKPVDVYFTIVVDFVLQ